MENKETIALIQQIDEHETPAGVKYWKIKADIGTLSTFDDKLKKSMANFVGKKVRLSYAVTPKGFYNLKSISPDQANLEANKAIPEVACEDKELSIVEARKAKDQGVYTSYAKDVFIAMLEKMSSLPMEDAVKLMDDSIKLVKQAKQAFA